MKVVSVVLRNFQEMIDDLGKTHRATEKARQTLQRYAVEDGHWAEYTLELWKNALEQIGFTNVEISYSGFCSQGDGASFTAGIDFQKLTEFFGSEIEPNNSISGDPEDFRPWLLHSTNTRVGDSRYLWLSSSDDMVNYHITAAAIVRRDRHYSHESTCYTEHEFDEGCRSDGSRRGEWIDGKPNPHADGHWECHVPHVEAVVNEFFQEVEAFRYAVCKAIYKQLEEEYTFRQEDEQLIEDSEANDYTFDEEGDRKNG